uniref:Uncharacterized protein n=1 Tax=Myoviridae sp. ctPJU6 TaxID=2827684 RepID=A0A8S5TJ55_9CAUD|nr:MAG TPA: hypothetical protein [Myoviridae sp. ctPJU6]
MSQFSVSSSFLNFFYQIRIILLRFQNIMI